MEKLEINENLNYRYKSCTILCNTSSYICLFRNSLVQPNSCSTCSCQSNLKKKRKNITQVDNQHRASMFNGQFSNGLFSNVNCPTFGWSGCRWGCSSSGRRCSSGASLDWVIWIVGWAFTFTVFANKPFSWTVHRWTAS